MTQEEQKKLYLSCATQEEYYKIRRKLDGLNWNDPEVKKHRSQIDPKYITLHEEIFPWHYDVIGMLVRGGREVEIRMEKGATPVEKERALSHYEYLRTEIRGGKEVNLYKEKEQDA